MHPDTIETERMLLVPATRELIEVNLESDAALAAAMDAELPADWPPPFHTDELLRRMLDILEQPGDEVWWMHFFLARADDGLTLIGEGGFKGRPGDDGAIEIGYALVPSARGRGYATEASLGMIATGWERGATVVRAETLPDLEDSIEVMTRAGMTPARSERAGVVAYEVRRD